MEQHTLKNVNNYLNTNLYSYFETSSVNFTNILQAAFSYKSFLCSFYVLTSWVFIFCRKDFGAKAAHKMLVKLTPGCQISNIYLNVVHFFNTTIN
jgi:hypothetical protein